MVILVCYIRSLRLTVTRASLLMNGAHSAFTVCYGSQSSFLFAYADSAEPGYHSSYI